MSGRLPFVYEPTGAETFFTDYRDPDPRARDVFAFHGLRRSAHGPLNLPLFAPGYDRNRF